ncbi:glycerol-3-phosphate transporter periplasmic binding protein [compost metagenome]
MKRNGWMVWGNIAVIIVVIIAFYTATSKSSSGINEGTVRSTALSLWVYSPGWETYVNEYRQQHADIEFDVRYFRSSEQLFDELMASISANAAPNLAEIHSFYGISQLVDTGAVVPIRDLSIAERDQFPSVFTLPFHDQNEDWALPIGASMPLLYYRNELLNKLSLNQFASWDEVTRAAVKSEADSVVKGPGGIAIDRELPWYLANMSSSVTTANSIWWDWVHSSKIMKPLHHHKAASDFINGKVGMFISSSEMLPTIERYVGGRFAFSSGRMPTLEQAGIIPYIHGMVVMKSSADKIKAVNSFLSYMTAPTTQASLWHNEGMIPVRSDVVNKLEQELNGSSIRRTIIDSIPLFHANPPGINDLDKWTTMQRLLEQLELDPEKK